MTKSETAKLVAMLLHAYPQAQFAPASSAVYEAMLSDLDAATALAAVERWIQTSKWLPTVAELRASAAEIKYGPKRLGAEAWGEALDAVQRVGHYRPAPNFTDPLVGECVRLMGWQHLCASENGTADRARFIELYEGLAERERERAILSPGLLPPPKTAELPAWHPQRRVTELALTVGTGPAAPAPQRPRELPTATRKSMTAAELDAALGAK